MQLLGLTGGFKKEWHYYKTSGWLLKVSDGKKALFYLIPLGGFFNVSLTLRETERETLMRNDALLFAWGDMKNAKKYPEGYAMQFQVDDAASSDCLIFIGELIKLRKSS